MQARGLLYSGGTGGLGAEVHADLPGEWLGVGLLFGPAVQGFGGIGQAVEFGGRRSGLFAGVLHTGRGERLHQLGFPCRGAIGRVHIGHVPRPAEENGRAGHRSHQAGPEIMPLQRAGGRIHGRLGNAFHRRATVKMAEVDGNRTHLGLC